MARLKNYFAPWRLGLLFTAILIPTVVAAGPSVNVAVSAAFNAGPYLLELLETAAEENSTSYFPLLDRIAEGVFVDALTEKDLYEQFLQVLQDDGHVRDAETLSLFKFALSIRSTAPRIQAHYQYYNTSVEAEMMVAQDAVCPVWAYYEGHQYCSPSLERAQQSVSGDNHLRTLPFDRSLGDSESSLILYADIKSPMFNEFHPELSKRARAGEFSYRVRYRPSKSDAQRPLFVHGYGVELALKRTDYIVIDDREADQNVLKPKDDVKPTLAAVDDLKEESPADLKPLSASEVSRLGLSAASFVMSSENPFGTLLKLSQDFPRHSAAIAARNATPEFLTEFRESREMLPPGTNVIWINGVQMDPRTIDAFSLLGHLRHERKLINGLRGVGLSAKEAVTLLSDPIVAKSQVSEDVIRYDYRDDIEGGGVIIWLNDFEKDQRYEEWPTSIQALLQPTYPGQLPPVRRDVHNVVIPVNFADPRDVHLVVESIQVFVKRKIAVRFGLVPTLQDSGSVDQAKVTHYLFNNYGLVTALTYLEDSLSAKKVSSPHKGTFQAIVAERKPREGATLLSFEEVLKSDKYDSMISATKSYLKRLAADRKDAPFFANGAALLRDENWIQLLIARVSKDLEAIQRAIFAEDLEEESWVPQYYLADAITRRNALILPEDPDSIKILDLNELYQKYKAAFDTLLRIPAASESSLEEWATLLLVADFDTEDGRRQLAQIPEFKNKHPEAEVLLLHNGRRADASTAFSATLYGLRNGRDIDSAALRSLLKKWETPVEESSDSELAFAYWQGAQLLGEELRIKEGDTSVLLNGRMIGPIPSSFILEAEDLQQLLSYERKSRIDPVARATLHHDLATRFKEPLDFAILTSLVALSTESDVPEGIYDSGPHVRSNRFENWDTTYSAITVSKSDDPSIQIVAAVDPTTEVAQRWVPILKVLSELNGVNLKLYLNPRELLQELPIKRFYRHILAAEPGFGEDGSLVKPQASFQGVPAEALLNLGMDVPSSWLVAPKESIHDLDNIKLSSLKEGTDVDAIYELEHILIEGHSRDTSTGMPPKGVQLLLGTEKTPHFDDTIIMANLGYFQFKAQPGIWKITLKPGRSENIFNLDSVGGQGYKPKAGDNNNDVALLSFQGKTLFPRLSRKPGHEEDDVLDIGAARPGSARDYISKGLNFASGILSGVKGTPKERQADINIFSVASGHLYERMLNIMMVSVMRHTKHTVKFWFIEQFLSPSFKSLLPHLAKEYNFSYEMVTYKWPHWLRAQREKQREIWGYKILFLDVLFPLSLDKVIFVDADQIVRTDMYDLVSLDLEGAPYGFTPMGDSRTTMEGFRFWKQGYWKSYLRGKPYHISALYVVDLKRFRQLAAGDRLRGQYHTLSADPNSLSNLDQDLPNHMQHVIPIKSLPQEWLWCETWCADEELPAARTIDLCNNPMTKEPKLDRARRQIPEWTVYDDEIAAFERRVAEEQRGAAGEEEEEDEGDDDFEGGEKTGWKDEL
ncbi:hypothetical protein AJ80_04436 [Polytolypa hystricis UAMH7299]|uniref:UDP-glucose:glycoprotein glucosyltransferase n=1 Tax=Polytolypa hystricis (strain UAMH7299) TaxID=1447883 RepID=A0A2B7YCQ3_POLH7|nr:hypothetical protein AJ80_04436 [Polytolypa hystricis UAMH7299]